MSKKKRVFMILGAVLGFVLNGVSSGVAISAIEFSYSRTEEGVAGFTFMMLFSFLFIVASGFFTEQVSFRTRKMSAKTSFIFMTSLTLAFGIMCSLIICLAAYAIFNSFSDSYYVSYGYYIVDSELLSIFIISTTHLFGFGIGFFASKLLATLSKKAPGVALADEPRVVMEQGDLFIAEEQQKPNEKAKVAAQPEKKLSYLEEYKKNMYGK